METAELDTSEIELRERGQLTLPKSLRDALHLETGDALRAVGRRRLLDSPVELGRACHALDLAIFASP